MRADLGPQGTGKEQWGWEVPRASSACVSLGRQLEELGAGCSPAWGGSLSAVSLSRLSLTPKVIRGSKLLFQGFNRERGAKPLP